MKNKTHFDKPTIYISHPIRGTTGDMKGNCKLAIRMVTKLRKIFPEINFYLPAEGDLVLQILYNSGKVSANAVLWADLEILKSCSGWIFLHWDESSGCETEREEAKELGLVLPGTICDVYDDVSRMNYGRIRKRFNDIVERAKIVYKDRKDN